MPRVAPYLVAILASLANACGGSDPAGPGGDPNTGSSSQVTYSGAVAASFSGTAIFSSIVDDVFGVVLAPPAGQLHRVQINRESGGRPTTGTYQITNTGSSFVAIGLANNQAFQSTSGTLTITASSAAELRGQFSIQGELSTGGGVITVSGSFVARCAGGLCS